MFSLNNSFRFSFYGLSDWTLQSNKLATLLERETTKTKSVIAHKTRENFWKYLFKFEGKKTKVYKKFLINLYQISRKRVKTVEKKIIEGSVIADKRGAHPKRSKTNENIWDSMHEFLGLIPSRTSHNTVAQKNVRKNIL